MDMSGILQALMGPALGGGGGDSPFSTMAAIKGKSPFSTMAMMPKGLGLHGNQSGGIGGMPSGAIAQLMRMLGGG